MALDHEDEEEKRKRRAGVGIDIEREAKARPANDHPDWIRTEDGAWEMMVGGERVAALIPNEDPRYSGWWLSVGIGTDDLPDHGWSHVDFDSLEAGKETLEKWWDHARNGEAYQPERPERPEVTREAIERDPWNAVALDLPANADTDLLLQVAATARDLRFELDERAEHAATPGQAGLWAHHAERAEGRYKLAEMMFIGEAEARDQPFSQATIDYDPWTAIYWPIPPNADVALLSKAYHAAMQCAGAVAGEPGPTPNTFEPTLFMDASREQNFERAVLRIDELDRRAHQLDTRPNHESLNEPQPDHETIEEAAHKYAVELAR